jgi:hypothetical protein
VYLVSQSYRSDILKTWDEEVVAMRLRMKILRMRLIMTHLIRDPTRDDPAQT